MQTTKKTNKLAKFLGYKVLAASSLLLGAVLLIGACGGMEEAEIQSDEAANTDQRSRCQVSIMALAGGSGLKGVLFKDEHDADPGTPDIIEFEVVTGMYEGTCDVGFELFANGEPTKLVKSNGETSTFLASVRAAEPQVLLTAYCGHCGQGVWGATIE